MRIWIKMLLPDSYLDTGIIILQVYWDFSSARAAEKSRGVINAAKVMVIRDFFFIYMRGLAYVFETLTILWGDSNWFGDFSLLLICVQFAQPGTWGLVLHLGLLLVFGRTLLPWSPVFVDRWGCSCRNLISSRALLINKNKNIKILTTQKFNELVTELPFYNFGFYRVAFTNIHKLWTIGTKLSGLLIMIWMLQIYCQNY